MNKNLVIEIRKRMNFDEFFSKISYAVSYCGPNNLMPNYEESCSTFRVQTQYLKSYEPNKEYIFSLKREFPCGFGKKEERISSTQQKIDLTMYRLAKKVAQLYIERCVPENLRDSVTIMDLTNKKL